VQIDGQRSRGMILAQGARGREFDSLLTPFCCFRCICWALGFGLWALGFGLL
jgi:hypothetical protein